MNNKPSIKETFKSSLQEIPWKEKILILVQIILSLAIIIIAVLGLTGIGNDIIMNLAAYSLLFLLLVLSAIKIYPARKLTALIYAILAMAILYLIRNMISLI